MDPSGDILRGSIEVWKMLIKHTIWWGSPGRICDTHTFSDKD